MTDNKKTKATPETDCSNCHFAGRPNCSWKMEFSNGKNIKVCRGSMGLVIPDDQKGFDLKQILADNRAKWEKYWKATDNVKKLERLIDALLDCEDFMQDGIRQALNDARKRQTHFANEATELNAELNK